MSAFQTNQNDDDGDTAHEPTVQEIDEIYNFLLTTAAVEDGSAAHLNPKIERMLLTLDRVSNSIHRREEKEEQEVEELEKRDA